jgi:hypothetical protein
MGSVIRPCAPLLVPALVSRPRVGPDSAGRQGYAIEGGDSHEAGSRSVATISRRPASNLIRDRAALHRACLHVSGITPQHSLQLLGRHGSPAASAPLPLDTREPFESETLSEAATPFAQIFDRLKVVHGPLGDPRPE